MRKSLANNTGLKLLAFLAAFLLWLVVVNTADPVTDKTYSDIIVTVEHEEVITEDAKTYQIVDNTQHVNVVVYGKRSVLNKIKADDIVATANMKELFLESQIPIEIAINGFEGRYESASANPRNLQVRIEENTSKTFPITPVSSGTVRDGFVLGELRANPEKVTLNGPESVIDSISKVEAKVTITGLAKDTELASALTLYDADGEVIDQSLLGNNLGDIGVSVQVSLLHTKSVPVVFDTSSVIAAEGYSIADIKYSPQEIEVAGDLEVLNELTEIKIPAEALESDPVAKRKEETVDVTEYIPDNLKLANENENNVIVTITVDKNGTKSFNLPVGSVTVKNLDDDLKLTYNGTEDLEAHIRGSQEQLDTLDVDKLASIDLEEFTEAGDYTVPVTLELPDGCTLEGDVEVAITLKKK